MILFSQFFTKENIINITDTGNEVAIQLYPSWLVLDISAASWVTTNSSGPTIISMNSITNIFSWTKFMMGQKNKKEENTSYANLLVIDTIWTWSIESYNTVALLNNTQLIVQANRNEKRIYEIAQEMKDAADIHITPELVQNKINEFSDNIKNNVDSIMRFSYTMISIFWIFILIFGSFFIGLFAAISLYLYAGIVWIMSKILKTEYSYKQAYSMSVLGFTLPFCLLLASTRVRILVLCIIVWRVMYLHKEWTKKNINN